MDNSDYFPPDSWSDAQRKFVADFKQASLPAPMPGPEGSVARIRAHTRIVVEMRAGGDSLWLGSLYCFRPNNGHGGAALGWLCALADRHALNVEVMAWPIGHWAASPLATNEGLEAWYQRRGFEGPSSYLKRVPALRR